MFGMFPLYAQTPATGALAGLTLDQSGALIKGASVTLVRPDMGKQEFTTSDEQGRFSFLIIAPGTYEVCATRPTFAQVCSSRFNVNVTETRHIELRLPVATVISVTQVLADSEMVQRESSSLGRVVNEEAIRELPLVTRNFAQIAGLSAGVSVGVSNAGELGLGATSFSQINKSTDGIFVHGLRSYDNNWQLDGISVNDAHGNGSASGGIPIPNPDTIQEFKVQTGLYDAAYGRYAGANVSVVTKSGTNDLHGTVFEFFRNEALNANDYFRNQTGQPRPILRQNQFGAVIGGPIKKDKLFFFGSYQGMRQLNGLAAGQARVGCAASLLEPPLTNDRSSTALGQMFAGTSGVSGGVAVRGDGSNINPVALALLNLKLSDASYLIPTPQTVDPSKPLASQGLFVATEPCRFDEDQFSINMDYLPSQKGKISGRFFFADNDQTIQFPGNFFNPDANIPGFPSFVDGDYRTFSLAHTYTISSTWLNEVRIGYVRTKSSTQSTAPFKWSDLGVAEGETSEANELPNLNILGSVAFASAFPYTFTQNTVVLSDILSVVHGAHNLRFGGSLTRLQDDFRDPGIGSFVQFLSWPDFLLGLDAAANGTRTFSNVYASIDDFGLFDRDYRVWEASAFAQDDYRIRRSLTLNLGLRYERLGQFGDSLGRNSSFDVSKADSNPSAAGSVAGYIVASNFSGTLPAGVLKSDNTFANNGLGQNTIAPRIGFAWQMFPRIERIVLRGGYGLYFSRPTGQAFFQNSAGAPFALLRLNTGLENSAATFQSPFPEPFPTPDSFPTFPPYSPSNTITIFTTSPGFRSARVQQFSLSLQAEVLPGCLLEIGYVTTAGSHLQRLRSLNQAELSSPQNPIRGETTNTVANVPLRVPILGIHADSLQEMESEGRSQYNGLEASLTKRLDHGIQFLASYTFSKTLDTDGADVNGTSAGIVLTLGDQNSSKQRWGRASFDRTQRLVVSATWSLPNPSRQLKFLGQWALGAIVTIQSGSALTISDTNPTNIFGISEDRAQLSGSCKKNQLVNHGPIESKLNSYFNTACFTNPPVIGADGIGTAFGNSETGIVDGPGQANFDVVVSKAFTFAWPHDKSVLTFRAGFYNALNHPQFSNPDSNFKSTSFGVTASTSVNARVLQLALKLAF